MYDQFAAIACREKCVVCFRNERPFRSRNGRIGRKEVTGNTEEVPIELIITKIAINNVRNGRDQLVKLADFVPPSSARGPRFRESAFPESFPARFALISHTIRTTVSIRPGDNERTVL